MSSVSIAAEQAFPEEEATVFVAEQMRPIRWQLYLGLVGLLIGGYLGLLQALDRIGIDLYAVSQLQSYYQGLTLHGVLLVLVFTFTFSNSFVTATTMRGFNRPMASTALVHGALWTAVAGVILAGYAMLANQATVLFTFYTPMEASSLFYLGAVLLVVSTWIVSANQIMTWRAWRREHPGERIPLLAFVSLVTYFMWDIASIGLAVEVVGFILPWSFGILDTVDPQLNRMLFWLTGHPIVYFWLLPAYISWYMMIPKQVGGRLYSDGLTRFVFILFLLFSTPTGLHHQFSDPGPSELMKGIHTVSTFIVFFPSLITAFTIMAALESGGRRNGGRGIFGWITHLPWGNPAVTAQLVAMLVFTLGGATGLINASLTVNQVIHNTAFVPGHFHMTVGTAVALTFMGIAYWYVPFLIGKKLFAPRLALVQSILWGIGVLIFARGQISGGLLNMPRRTAIGLASYSLPGWDLANWLTAIGGIIMTISGVIFFVVMIGTFFFSRQAEPGEYDMPVSEPLHGPQESWAILDRLGFWSVVGIVLVILAWGPVIIQYLPGTFTSPGIRVW